MLVVSYAYAYLITYVSVTISNVTLYFTYATSVRSFSNDLFVVVVHAVAARH